MRIRNKIAILFLIVFCIIVAALLFIIRTEDNKTKVLIESHQSTQNRTIENIIKFKSELLNKVTYDYTYWDDMVAFVSSGDTTWAKENLNSLSVSFNINACWVFNTKRKLVYQYHNLTDFDSTLNLFPKEIFIDLLKSRQNNYFLNTNAGLLEISGATIHPTKDIEKITPACGYFFIAKIWDQKYLQELESISDCKISFYPIEKETPASNHSLIITTTNLNDFNNKPIIKLVCEKNLDYVSIFKNLTFNSFTFISLLALLLVIIFGVSFNLFVNKPISSIIKFLDSQDVHIIDNLKNQKNEFGRISRLLIEFFNHQSNLEKEIRERKIAQDSLFESQKRLQDIINNAPNVAIQGYDIDGKVLFWNETATHIYGYSEKEVLGKEIDQSILNKNSFKEFINTLKEIDRTNKPTEPIEWEIKRKDDKIITVLSTIFPIYSDISDEKIFVCMDIDLSDRKELEVELQLKNEEILAQNEELTVTNQELTELYSKIRSSEEIFRSVVEQANDGISLMDAEGNIILWNKAMEKMTGLDSKDALGKKMWDFDFLLLPLELRTPENKAKFENILQQIINTKTVSTKVQYIERDFQIKNERFHKYVQLSTFIINTEKSFLVGRIVHDLTSIIEVKKAVEKSEKRYRELTELLPIVVFETDLNAKFTYLNKKAYDIFGYSMEDIENGLTIFDIVPKERHDEVIARIGDVISNTNKFIVLETIVYTKNRKEILCNIYPGIYYNNDNEPIGVRGALIDISLHKQAEELLRQLEVSKKTTEIKQQFLANMSHEIRTPMMGIIGMTDLLNKTPINEQQKDFIETIKDSSKTLLSIINDILELSKIEAGKTEIKPVPFNIHSITQKLRKLFSALAKHKNLSYYTSYTNDIPDYILADKNKITQIITNLVSNAVKFTQTGSITIKLSLESQNNTKVKIKIEVIDTGIGIEEKDKEMIFSTFTQVDSANTRNFDGTGLGLSICKKLTQLMGGEIGVISEIGKGSNFWFTFDAETVSADQVVNSIKTEQKQTINKLNLSILLVEDKFVNQKVIELMLKDVGCSVDIASNGKIALEMYKPGKYDIILMDIQMPVMDGITALGHLRKKYKQLEPVIALSANVLEGDEDNYLENGMSDFIGKPVNQEDLIEKIAKWAVNLKK